MQDLPSFTDPNLLVGAEHFSDAGVYRLADDLAIVQSVDFFPPIVDDPFVFGQIAAANALSDLYATGAQPRTALNVVGFPDKDLDLSVLGEILRGGAERVQAADAVIVGGHSVRDAEVKYGLSVTGTVDPSRMMTNRGARAGDLLVLTKPLGTGFIATAARAGKDADGALAAATASMITLNRVAAEAAVTHGVRGATDITGFGLAGHAGEMAHASGVTLVLHLEHLPALPGVADAIDGGHLTRANATNRTHVEPFLQIDAASDSSNLPLLFDPQTSGGLLLAMPPSTVEPVLAACKSAGLDEACVVGSVEAARDVALVVR
ncbi:MAG: selenide, water dikinase SelD [Phycisphaerales bacterium]|nr:selenide, water dikinase SelD [Phycisphaerae bacterium]NNF43709.1 selenide, water dikinase SelD [Phycisphaerales bacterium]NNM25310.1 selenide, water dikinase SelD [Phycisphaerales bacterium]